MTIINPKQLLVRSPKGGNKPIGLLFDTSIFDVRLELPDQQDYEAVDVIHVMSLPTALVSCTPGHFSAYPIEIRAALAMVSSASDMLHKLLRGGHSKVAGRLAGAFRNIGRVNIAENIIETMKSAGYTVNENDPFEDKSSILFSVREVSPYVNRLRMSWAAMRKPVLEYFPPAPSTTIDTQSYLKQIDDIYVTDAYHSLSIEGYQVTTELIERVRSGNWNPDSDENDRNQRNALAARGYWQAFQAVKASVEKVIIQKDGAVAGNVAQSDHDK